MSYAAPLKILQVVSGRELNGALTYCETLTDRLRRRGHEVHVVCRGDCWLRDRLDGVPVLESDLNRTWQELRRVAAYVAEHRFDLIHTHMSRAHFFGVILRVGTGVPVIATAHSCNFQPYWRFNDFVLANSRATLDYHRRVNWVRPQHSRSVYCFTDLDRFRELRPDDAQELRRDLGVTSDEYLIGMVGQVCTRKGQHVLCEALPEVMRRVPEARVVMVGPNHPRSRYARRLRQMLAAHDLESRVIWAGATDDVPRYLSALDLSVVPSLKEPLGLVAVESLAAGTPVIASRTGGLPEIVEHEVTGLLVPRGEPRALARAIVRAACSPQWSLAMAQRGQERVLELFDPDRLTQDVEATYQQVTSSRQVLVPAA
ncbi:MAG: glycosyltransferase family 4 protein [Planctomycetota bacterium]